jgi:Flp pilus assembly protein TadB
VCTLNVIIDFIRDNTIAFVLLLIFNFILVRQIIYKIEMHLNRFVRDTLGNRNVSESITSKMKDKLFESIDIFESRKKGSFIEKLISKSRQRLKLAGHTSDKALAIYLSLQYILPFISGVLVLIFLHTWQQALVITVFIFTYVRVVISMQINKITMKFQRYMYKIYKYLSNQISSGTLVSDAIKSVYLIVDDKDIRSALIRLSAHYELSNNIDSALSEFRQSFDCQEAESLCVALKQGVETGDNKEILSRQEKMMFSKYLNFIQAETDRCTYKSFFAAIVFCAIVTIMIIIPLLGDIQQSIKQILIN